jgi:uncharacterized protein YecE (DUF72 family)
VSGTIRVGVGGWVFKPWRGTFFPKGLPQTRELEHAGRALTTIEINGTFYRTQKPDTFRKWADDVPDDFVFSVKGPQFATNRRVLSEAGPSIDRFFGSGVLELKSKLGPIMWQMAPAKKFDPEDFAAVLALLPPSIEGTAIRHAIEVRHASFVDPAFIDLLRKHSVATVLVDSGKHPPIADVTGDFVYLRLQGTSEQEPAGYPPAALDAWTRRAKAWAAGSTPEDLTPVAGGSPPKQARDVFVYMIAGAKVRAPAAATAMLERLGKS